MRLEYFDPMYMLDIEDWIKYQNDLFVDEYDDEVSRMHIEEEKPFKHPHPLAS